MQITQTSKCPNLRHCVHSLGRDMMYPTSSKGDDAEQKENNEVITIGNKQILFRRKVKKGDNVVSPSNDSEGINGSTSDVIVDEQEVIG